MIEHLVIDRFGQRGDGVTDTSGGPIYVPFTLPGETVEVAPWLGHPDRRQLVTVETASPDRVPAICPHFGTCGGCGLQHAAPALYRDWKRGLVVTALAQAGIDTPVEPLVDAHGDGRRRAVLHARRGTHEVLEVGFAAPRAHHLVAIDRCPVLAPSLDGAIAAAWAIAETLAPTAKPLDIQVTASQEGLDVDVRGSGRLDAKTQAALARLAPTHRLARITRHGELVIQRAVPTVQMGRAIVPLPPGAFLQATEAGEAAIAAAVAARLGKARQVADLFCGVGPFALRLAETARVAAYDSDAPAIAALKQAIAHTQGLKPVIAEARDLFRRPLIAKELTGVDVVVFDPPRQGAEAQAQELARSAVSRVVAVSCNVTTFVRDALLLIAGGFRPGPVTPIDQFRYSPHVELVAGFER